MIHFDAAIYQNFLVILLYHAANRRKYDGENMQKDNNMSNNGSSTSSFVSGLGRPDPGTPPTDYRAFLESKTHYAGKDGFKPNFVPDYLFGFQKDLLTWAVEKGRAAIFADCGLGKTPLQLVWAENVVRETNGRVLVLTPLAVSQQTISEGEKFGIEVKRSRDGRAEGYITVTNYEQLEKFNPSDFVAVVCDESSILKNYSGSYRLQITEFMRKMRYRLLCTATAAPNDYTELGTSSEALGVMGYMDMLNYFFKNDNNTSDTKRKWVKTGGGAPRIRGVAEMEGGAVGVRGEGPGGR